MSLSATPTSSSIRLTFHLRHRVGTAEPTAWLLLGEHPGDWLAELCRWGVPLTSIRLMPIGASPDTRHAIGVLAFPDRAASVAVGRRALPYVCIAGRLFIPLDSAIHPPLSDIELRAACPSLVSVLHPSIGLVGFDDREVIRASDLIGIAPPLPTTWDDAEPAVYAEPRVRAIVPLHLPGSDEVIELGRDDIGEVSPGELPPLPSESPMEQLSQQAKLGWFKLLKNILPGKGGERAAARVKQLQEDIAAAQQREVARLMKMLEEDPDRGLRFAIRLDAPTSARGTIKPGSQLAQHGTDFNLKSLFGSRPAAPWASSKDAQERLRARYRALAQRELSLGRHRRAAYIYAELLSDFHNAAIVLQHGRFHREAAVLFEQKLNNRRAAAMCLERGGLLAEAAAMYEAIGQFEKAGDLFRQLANEEQAKPLYEKAVLDHQHKGNPLGAAALLEHKLSDADGALKLLDEQWFQHTPAAHPCLRESFRLLSRHGRHGEAERRLRGFRENAQQATNPTATANTLVDIAKEHPTKLARALAEDAARLIIGYALASETHALERTALLQLVGQTAIDDRLLHRDAMRYRDRLKPVPPPMRPAGVKPILPSTSTPSRWAVKITHRFRLEGADVRWQTAVATANGFFALGTTENRVFIARCSWKEPLQTAVIHFHSADDFRFDIAAIGNTLIATPLDSPLRLTLMTMPAMGGFGLTTTVGDPLTLLPPRKIHGICAGDDGDLYVLYHPDGAATPTLVLDHKKVDGTLIASIETAVHQPPDDSRAGICMAVHGEHVLITCGNELHRYHPREAQQPMTLPGYVSSIATPPRHTALRVALSFDEFGSAMVWPQTSSLVRIAVAIGQARTLILGDGAVVAIGRDRGAGFDVINRKPQHAGDFDFESGPPTAALRTDDANGVAVLYADGRVVVARAG